MITDHYVFSAHNFNKLYFFKSEGKRTIAKVVQFSLEKNNLYNLGLADFELGKLVFDKFSGNEDARRVFNTVAAIALHFFDVFSGGKSFDSSERKKTDTFVQQNFSTQTAPNSRPF